ncbi:MAG: hypothetical protein RR954_08900 [Christensenellaceae bacterium]
MSDCGPLNTHEYLLHINEKDIKATLYDLGTMYDYIGIDVNNIHPVLRSTRLQQEKNAPDGIYEFLLNADFLDAATHWLTNAGKDFFEVLYIHHDIPLADEHLKLALLKNPVVNLMGQVFYGRGRQSVEQLRDLLNYHKISDKEITYSEVITLLTLLNKFAVLVYDKKNKQFYLKETAGGDTIIPQYYVNPTTPFSNIYNLRKVIRTCRGSVYWIDKHFRKEGFEILLDGLPFDGVSSVTVISGPDNFTQSAKADYSALKSELSARLIVLNWKIITDSAFKWHDRWLLADNQCHNIPPVLAIIRGQRSDILQTKLQLDIHPFLIASTSVDISS